MVIWFMKTTLNLDDRLMRAAKRLAAERGVTLTSVVEDALRASLEEHPPTKRARLHFPTVAGERVPDVDLGDRDALYERMESDS